MAGSATPKLPQLSNCMENQTRNGATLSSHDLLSLVESTRAEISAKRADLKSLVAEIKRVKQEESVAKKAVEMAEASRKFSGLWIEAIESGMTEREVISLQNLDTKLRVVGEMFGVTAGRAREIRMKAERKMRHPKRHDLARKLGLSVRLFIDDDNREL